MIHSADITFQMLEDWRNVDLNSITKQTLYTMEDTRDEHRKLIIQCKMLHQGVCLFICLKRKSMLVNKVAHSHPVLLPQRIQLSPPLVKTESRSKGTI